MNQTNTLEVVIVSLMEEWYFDALEEAYDNHIADLVSDYYYNLAKLYRLV